MADAEKKLRTVAKRRFTRCYNRLNDSIINNAEGDIIVTKFDELKLIWEDVQSTHDNYLIAKFPDDDENIIHDDEEKWLTDLEEKYEIIQKAKCDYIRSLEATKKKSTQINDSKETIDGLILQRNSLTLMMNNEIRIVEESIRTDAVGVMKNQILDSMKYVKSNMEKCKDAHLLYISHVTGSTPAEENKWIDEIQMRYEKCNKVVYTYLTRLAEKETKEKQKISTKMDRIKMPSFSGNVREYAKFKSDFKSQVEENLDSQETVAYVLRSCLKDEAASLVENIDAAVDIWRRLDKKYGQPSSLIDVVMDDIRSIGIIKEEKPEEFIKMVNVIEKGYIDLKRLKLEKEISNSVTVSMPEGRLPPMVKREWSKEVNKVDSKVDPCNKFPPFMAFLQEQRTILEYEMASLRIDDKEDALTVDVNLGYASPTRSNFRCNIHKMNNHMTEECREYTTKTPEEKLQVIRNLRACWSCLKVGHKASDCRNRKRCEIDNCNMFHHPSLHETSVNVNTIDTKGESCDNTKCLLQIMKVRSVNGNLSVLWDSGASVSLITFRKAKELKLSGKEVQLSVVKVGGQSERIISSLYTLPLLDRNNNVIKVKVYGMECISRGQNDDSTVLSLFKDINPKEIQRSRGEVDVLIGFNYASLHPTAIRFSDNMMLLENRFGKCLAGTHHSLKESQKAFANHVEVYNVRHDDESFLNIEDMGISCSPRCGNCSCRKCALGSSGLSIKEEREQSLINEGLSYNEEGQFFVANYPWIKDPNHLPDNYNLAKRMLESTEKRLSKDVAHSKVYDDQIKDMVIRGVGKILTTEELLSYKGPKYYLSHHEVMKEGSTTPCRIVFNSSAKYMGECINNYWAKGANMIKDLMGVLIRFRENRIAIVGDISKMYHAVKIGELDQHTHRFLWRNMETHRKPDVYTMTSVSFGDMPAGNIAIAVLNKCAEMGSDSFPRAAETVLNNTYVDNINDSFDNENIANQVTSEIDQLLMLGGFKVKGWITSYDNEAANGLQKKTFAEREKVLGMHWEVTTDLIRYSVTLNFSKKKHGMKGGTQLGKDDIPLNIPDKLTKRMVLSQINSVFDPLGLISPFTVKAKILLKDLWRRKFDWDDEIIGDVKEHIISFFKEMFELEMLSFRRCLKPVNSVEDPDLVTFSDASTDAFGACSYLRWKSIDGTYTSVLVAAKNRVSPLKVLSIVRLELSAAVIAKRLAEFLEKETRFKIKQRYFFVDSKVVKSMICKESHAFNTFVAVRLGEIHRYTNPKEWFWLDGAINIADWITRGKTPSELDENSQWQRGPSFLSKPEEEWPINADIIVGNLPEENKVVTIANVQIEKKSIENVVDISRYSKYLRLIYVTARIISVFKHTPKPSLKNMFKFPADTINDAEMLWVTEAQKLLREGLTKGRYKKLNPQMRDDGIVIVKGRLEAWFNDNYNTTGLILLPHNHILSRLYAEYIHNAAHLGKASTVCKIRDRFWILKLPSLVASIRNKCVTCKKLNAKLQEQIMAQVPLHRLKPMPAFYYTYIDIFGPFKIRGMVNKRRTGKAFGVIFTCGNSRAVFCDVSPDYSMIGFLQTMRRFTSIRGFPSDVWSDCGSQLVAADKELRDMIKGFDKEKLKEFGADKGLKWHFSPPDAQWHNGCAESLIKSVKKAIKVAVGEQVLTFSELQTVLFEASNIVNERPIGVLNKEIDDGQYLCPNNLLLGRASGRVPSGPFSDNYSPRNRFLFTQKIIDSFWKTWTRDYFPSLMIHQKWHVQKRNLRIGDIVLIRDTNAVRGQWQLGQVKKVYPSTLDNLIRKVEVRYKVPSNKKCSTVIRAVQSLVVLLPVDD